MIVISFVFPFRAFSRISEGNANDQDQDFQRQPALAQEEKAEADGPLWGPEMSLLLYFQSSLPSLISRI